MTPRSVVSGSSSTGSTGSLENSAGTERCLLFEALGWVRRARLAGPRSRLGCRSGWWTPRARTVTGPAHADAETGSDRGLRPRLPRALRTLVTDPVTGVSDTNGEQHQADKNAAGEHAPGDDGHGRLQMTRQLPSTITSRSRPARRWTNRRPNHATTHDTPPGGWVRLGQQRTTPHRSCRSGEQGPLATGRCC